MKRRQVLVLGFVLVFTIGGFTAIAVGSAVADVSPEGTESDLIEVQTVTVDDADGEELLYEIAYHVGDDITEFIVTVKEGDVTGGTGFERIDEARFEWDGTTADPSLQVNREANQSSGQYDGLDFVHTDEWALTSVLSTAVEITATDEIHFERSLETDASGYTGLEMSYIGEYEKTTVSSTDETFTFIVIDDADPQLPIETLGDALVSASEQFDVGVTTAETTVYVVTDPIRRGGLATSGNADFWIHDESIEPPRTTLWHEYVHTRQEYQPAPETEWTIEAEADYYAYLLALKQGAIEYHDFYEFLEGAETDHETVVLAEPDTWAGTQADYELGALVLAALDAEIRELSGETDTYTDVLKAKNSQSDDTDGMSAGESISDTDLESFASDAARSDMEWFFEEFVRSHPDSVDVPGPVTYETPSTGAELEIDVQDGTVGAGSTGTVEFAVSNTGTGESRVPYLHVEVPDNLESEGVTVDETAGVASDVTGVDSGWALDHLDAGETVIVEYQFDAPEEASVEPDDIDAVVTDMSGNSAATSSAIDIVDTPTVTLDGPSLVQTDEAVTFDASQSTDDGEIVGYTWEVVSQDQSVSETDDPKFEHVFDQAGEHTVAVTAENDAGGTDTAVTTVLVNDEPSVHIDVPETASVGEPILATANVTNDVGTYEVEWEANGLEATAERVEFEFAHDGERELTVTVTDEHGATTTETAVVVVGDPDDSDNGETSLEETVEDMFGPGFGVVPAVLAVVTLVFVHSRVRNRQT